MKLFVNIIILSFSSMVILATDIQSQISNSSDDAEECLKRGTVGLCSSDLELIQDHDREQLVGLRFQNITIPKGAKVTNAYLQFTVDEKNSKPTNIAIMGELNLDAPTFTYKKRDISSRKKTSSSVKWLLIPTWSTLHEHSTSQQSSDIKSIIQEIINQDNWENGNSLVLILSGKGKRVAESYDGDKPNAPILHIRYENKEDSDEHESETENSGYIVKSHIISTSDDAEESNGYVNISSSDLEMIQDKNKHQTIGLRFTEIDIPKNANISKAYIQFTTDESSSEATNLTIHAEKVVNATTFVGKQNNISSRKKTKTSTKWSPKPWKIRKERGERQKTSDLNNIIQEIIDQENWEAGNSIAFIISGEGKRVAKSYKNHIDMAPMLYVEYNDNHTPPSSDDNNTTPPPSDNNHTDNNTTTIYVSTSNELRDAITSATDGKTIILKSGVYNLSKDIVVSQNDLTIASQYHITGDKSYIDSTIIKGRGEYANRMFDANPSPKLGANLKFIGLTIQDSGKFVTFSKGDDNLVSHCNLSKIQRDIISFDNTSGGKVLYSKIIGAGDDGIDIDTKSNGNFEIAHNQILNSGDDGIEIR